MSKLGEFVLELVVDAGKGELTVNNLVKSLGHLEVVSIGEIAILQHLANMLVDVTQASIGTALGLESYTAATGGSTKQLERWAAAGKLVGITNAEVASSLVMIGDSLAGLKFGKTTPLMNLMHPLGITLAQLKSWKPEELLEKIRNNPAFQKMLVGEQRVVLSEAGLLSMHRLVTRHKGGISDKEFSQVAKDAGQMPERTIEQFSHFHKVLVTIELLTERIGISIASWATSLSMPFFEEKIKALRVLAGSLEKDDEAGRQKAVGKFLAEDVIPDIWRFLPIPGGALLNGLKQGGPLTNAVREAAYPEPSRERPSFLDPTAGVQQVNNFYGVDLKDASSIKDKLKEVEPRARRGVQSNDSSGSTR